MKKIYWLIISLFVFIPLNVEAYGIEKYFIKTNIRFNGDIHVKELFLLNGEFNGFERTINYKNSLLNPFDNTLYSFEGSDIYNGSNVELIAIKDIPYDGNITFEDIDKEGTLYQYNPSAQLGQSGYYTTSSEVNGEAYRIYNYSSGEGKIFYIEYIIKDAVVLHNDYAELYLNIFSDELNESIGYLEARINLPSESEFLRTWAHGPLRGEIDPVNSNSVILKISQVNANTPIDYRIVFDKDLVNPTKVSNVSAWDKILEVETKRADEANLKREQLRNEQFIATMIQVIWIVGFVYVLVYTYKKYDKELPSRLNTKYYRDFPATYGPEVVSFLFDKKIETKDLSASLLNLIAKKAVSYQEIDNKQFELIYSNKEIVLSSSEKILVEWFFNDIGGDGKVTVKDINNAAKKYESFYKKYNTWKQSVKKETDQELFFETSTKGRVLGILYSLSAMLVLLVSNPYYNVSMVLSVIIIVMFVVGMVYYLTFFKRTAKGNEHYSMWNGLKNFIKDFGQFSHRDLPHVELWEKYLVYAMSFGLAAKLAKTMAIKFKEMGSTVGTYDLYYINRMMLINNSINTSVNNAMVNAASARAADAASRSSSGGGFGGGFSGGGGFGGGGGGGGRF
jgi:uncharacterized membrane protein